MDERPSDMAPFFARHDRTTQRVFTTAIAISVLVSAAILVFGSERFGSPGAIPAALAWAIVFPPLPIIGLYIGSVLMKNQRGRSSLMNADDARGVRRVAHAGTVFVTGIAALVIIGQVGFALRVLGVTAAAQGWTWRAFVFAVGLLMAYFGNAWPRVPTPRLPADRGTTQMKFNRFYGWMTVIHGLLLAAAALVLPGPQAFAIGAAVISASLLVFALGWVLSWYYAFRNVAGQPL